MSEHDLNHPPSADAASAPGGRNRRPGLLGLIYALLGTLAVSTSYVTAKRGLEGFNAATFSLVWTGAAAGYALLLVLITGPARALAAPAACRSRIGWIGLATGASMLLSWAGLDRLDPTYAAMLWRFSPGITLLLGFVVHGERLSRGAGPLAALMLLGGVISTLGQGRVALTGVVLTLLACLAVSAQFILAKSVLARMAPLALVFYRNGLGVAPIALWGIAAGQLNFDVAPRYWVVTLAGALLAPCASFILYFKALRLWGVAPTSVVQTIEPLFVLPMAWWWLGRILAGKELGGGALILGGAIGLVILHARPARTGRRP